VARGAPDDLQDVTTAFAAGVLACWRAGVLACWRAGVLAILISARGDKVRNFPNYFPNAEHFQQNSLVLTRKI
jgi:hypothetical protein